MQLLLALGLLASAHASIPEPSHDFDFRDCTTNVPVADTYNSAIIATPYNGPWCSSEGLNFDGANDYVRTTSWSFGGEPITVEVYVKYEDVHHWSRILDFGYGENNDNVVIANPGTTNGCAWNVRDTPGSSKHLEYSNCFTMNEWTHIVATTEGNTMKLYRNGVLVATETNGMTVSLRTRTYHYIGRSNWDHDGYFDGAIAYERFWHGEALGAEDIQSLYEARESAFPRPPPTPSSVASVVPPETAASGSATGAICFTGDSLLTLEDGATTKKFRDLKVGDVIMGADRNGSVSTSPVLFLPHPENDIVRKFDEIETLKGLTVRMTRNHLLPLCDGSLVTARSLREGDCVMTKDGEDNVAKTTQNIEAGGIYTAVTKNEFLVVDGVVASPFALAHGIAHSLFNRQDVARWCSDNAYLLPEAKDEEIKHHMSRRGLRQGPINTSRLQEHCLNLMEVLFENYKDEGVGWGIDGWGYRTFQTMRGTAANKPSSLQMRLSGF